MLEDMSYTFIGADGTIEILEADKAKAYRQLKDAGYPNLNQPWWQTVVLGLASKIKRRTLDRALPSYSEFSAKGKKLPKGKKGEAGVEVVEDAGYGTTHLLKAKAAKGFIQALYLEGKKAQKKKKPSKKKHYINRAPYRRRDQ